MTDSLLKKAKDFRETVLLAELGAWLHDLGKLSRQFVESKTDPAYVTADAGQETEPATKEWPHGAVLTQDREKIPQQLWDFLYQSHLTALDAYTLSGLISDHHLSKPGHILALLKQADRNDSGEDEYNAAGLPQSRPVQRATVFGQEDDLDLVPLDGLRRSLYAPLEALATASPYDRDQVWQLLCEALNAGLGKTQRAANDIRLDQHVWGVASRFKAFVMRDLLDPPAKGEIRNTFRLLTVQWNAWEAITPFARLSDVAGRMAMIARVREVLRQAIETEYAIGNRIYEDDDGIHFLVADLEWGTELETLARAIVNRESGGELLPVVMLSERTKRVKDPAGQMAGTERVTDLAPQMAEARKQLPIVGEPAWLEVWQETDARELCPVCRRRPSPGDGALCDWCAQQRSTGAEKRRERSGIRQDKKRPTQPAGTLQTGELADERGKTALIVARFDLEDWLKGDLLHTLFITSPQDMATVPSDSEEAKKVIPVPVANWSELVQAIAQIPEEYLHPLVNPDGKEPDGDEINAQQVNLRNWGKQRKETPSGQLARWLTAQFGRLQSIAKSAHSIQDVQGVPLREAFLLVLARKNPSAGRLLRVWQTTEKFLQDQAYALAGAVGPQRQRAVLTLDGVLPPEDYYTAELPVLGTVEVLVRTDGKVQTTTFVKPEQMARFQAMARGAPLRWVAAEKTVPADTVKIGNVLVEPYAPYQVITVSPNLLLAMVPADRALAIARQLQADYAKEFSKVQGRLPFHVGLVFMDAHYPMFAALDTARRLAETFDTLGNRWMEATVAAKTPDSPEAESYTLRLNSERFGSWEWTISARLGNGAPDWYHPYVLVKQGAGLAERGMSLQGPYGRWVHISQVAVGDKIEFLPNLLDFISLDTVSRRLEAGLLPDATRRPHALLGPCHSPRPYLLERVNELQAVWDAICNVPGMSESRLQAATTLLARKWEEWQLSQHDTHRAEYEWLVKHTVARDFAGNAVIERAILDGLYFDVMDLYRHILKQSLEKSKTQTTEEAAS